MSQNLSAELDQVIETIPKKPSVSIILTFEPKMMGRSALQTQLKQTLEKVTQLIENRYEKGIAQPMTERIRSIFTHLNFDTHKKSIGIFLSLVFEKVLYLDIPVEEKIIVNDSFEIRDFVYAKKEMHKYLVLQSYPFPVFVLGVPKVIDCFKALAKNTTAIIDYVHGNFDDASEYTLKLALTPFVSDWKKLKMTDLLHQLEKARNAGKLAEGIQEVYSQSALHKGREKNYMYPSAIENIKEFPVVPFHQNSCNHDDVDDLIEKVLKDGGDVEFVDQRSLRKHGHITLILNY